MLATASFMGFVPVRDLATARDFYGRTLGLTVAEVNPFAVVIDADGTMLRLTLVPDLTPQPFTVGGWLVTDLADAVRTLAGRGVRFRRYAEMDQDDLGIWTAPNGDRVAWFTDPDGNTLSLASIA